MSGIRGCQWGGTDTLPVLFPVGRPVIPFDALPSLFPGGKGTTASTCRKAGAPSSFPFSLRKVGWERESECMMRDDQETARHGGPPLPPARAWFPLLEGGPNFMSVYPARITCDKIASVLPASYKHYCSELLRQGTIAPKRPHSWSGRVSYGNQSALRFPSLGHTHTIKGIPPFFALSSLTKEEGAFQRRGPCNRPAPVPQIWKGSARFFAGFKRRLPLPAPNFGAPPPKKNKNKKKQNEIANRHFS